MNWYINIKIASKKLAVIRGPSGSGKSTLAEQLGPAKNIFTTDDFFEQEGEYQFDPQKLGEAHEWNQNRVKNAMEKGLSPIVVANTNVAFWEIRPYIEMAQLHDYDTEFIEPDWSPELKTPEGKWSIDFLIGKNIHDVDRDKIQSMIDRYEHDPTVEKVLKSKAPWEDL